MHKSHGHRPSLRLDVRTQPNYDEKTSSSDALPCFKSQQYCSLQPLEDQEENTNCKLVKCAPLLPLNNKDASDNFANLSKEHLQLLNSCSSNFLISQSARNHSLFACLHGFHSLLNCPLQLEFIKVS